MKDLSKYKPNPLDKESQILLEEIDTNCNTCKYFDRDLEWAKNLRSTLGINKISHSKGHCKKKNITVKPSNGLCTPENQDCWETRRK